MVARTFNLGEVAAHIRKRYGRIPGERRLGNVAHQMFGKKSELTRSEAVLLARKISLRGTPLTPSMVSRIQQYLLLNQKARPHERRSLAEIAKLASPKVDLSYTQIRRINDGVRQQIKQKGGKPTKFVRSVLRPQQTIVAQVSGLLGENPLMRRADAAKKLGLSEKRLAKSLKAFDTTFVREQVKAAKKRVQEKDLETKFSLTTRELVKASGLTLPLVMKYRIRRGRASGVEIRVTKLKKNMLSWLGALTTPESPPINIEGICVLSGASKLTALNALTQLKKQGFVMEIGYKNSSEYVISPKGISELNHVGASPKNREQRLSEMSVTELESARDRVLKARAVGVLITPSMFLILKEIIEQKNKIEESKRRVQ